MECIRVGNHIYRVCTYLQIRPKANRYLINIIIYNNKNYFVSYDEVSFLYSLMNRCAVAIANFNLFHKPHNFSHQVNRR